jgi:hypothetical protein
VTYTQVEGGVAVEGIREVGESRPPVSGPEDLALEILRVVVDEHVFEDDGGRRRFYVVKRAPVTPS